MFEGVVDLAAELVDLEHQMSDPKLHSDQNKARQVGRRFDELNPIVATWREYQKLVEDHAAAVELSMDDSSFKAEAEKIAAEVQVLADKLQMMLIPRDPLDGKDVIVEVQSGEGGEESALFAGD
jgi:peptide chain release factor 1